MPDDNATVPADRPGRGAAALADGATPGAAPADATPVDAGRAGERVDERDPAGAAARGITLTRGWALFLIAVGVWNWVIWPRFALAIWDDSRAWSTRVVGHGTPTGFLWIHAFLIVASVTVGTIVGVLGIRALLRLRRQRAS